jgi:non-ribosomal peptide synthetase-like protein
VSRWSGAYVPVWLKPGLVDSAQRWLYGTLFWPHWLRLAGARVGRASEISSLIDALPEMIEIGPHTFCADGIYLGGPRVHRGTVAVEPVRLESNVFLGNGAVVSGGVRVPDGALLGIDTVADAERLRPHTAWFGHPPFELPRRQIVAADSRLTDRPSALRYATRLFWELARFGLPVVPTLSVVLYVGAVKWVAESGAWWQLALAVPPVTLATALLPVLVALATKWLLLGRVQPGVHPFWSCWNGRWDFYCVVWNVFVRELAGDLRGTALLAVLLRAVGVRVGRGVVLDGRFAEDLPDPDMLTIEDGATVEGVFQAHTFEDRVLKNGRVVIRAGATVGYNAVLLYGADVGVGARVAPHSVVMKYERLLPDGAYEGFPIHRAPSARLP